MTNRRNLMCLCDEKDATIEQLNQSIATLKDNNITLERDKKALEESITLKDNEIAQLKKVVQNSADAQQAAAKSGHVLQQRLVESRERTKELETENSELLHLKKTIENRDQIGDCDKACNEREALRITNERLFDSISQDVGAPAVKTMALSTMIDRLKSVKPFIMRAQGGGGTTVVQTPKAEAVQVVSNHVPPSLKHGIENLLVALVDETFVKLEFDGFLSSLIIIKDWNDALNRMIHECRPNLVAAVEFMAEFKRRKILLGGQSEYVEELEAYFTKEYKTSAAPIPVPSMGTPQRRGGALSMSQTRSRSRTPPPRRASPVEKGLLATYNPTSPPVASMGQSRRRARSPLPQQQQDRFRGSSQTISSPSGQVQLQSSTGVSLRNHQQSRQSRFSSPRQSHHSLYPASSPVASMGQTSGRTHSPPPSSRQDHRSSVSRIKYEQSGGSRGTSNTGSRAQDGLTSPQVSYRDSFDSRRNHQYGGSRGARERSGSSRRSGRSSEGGYEPQQLSWSGGPKRRHQDDRDLGRDDIHGHWETGRSRKRPRRSSY